eukprot:10385303-Alexandrium_andersonii.AAC.1
MWTARMYALCPSSDVDLPLILASSSRYRAERSVNCGSVASSPCASSATKCVGSGTAWPPLSYNEGQ